jgi:hypothetical protein
MDNNKTAVKGSKRYALRVTIPWPSYRPPGGWLPSGRNWCFRLLLVSNIIFQHCPLIMEFTPSLAECGVDAGQRLQPEAAQQSLYRRWRELTYTRFFHLCSHARFKKMDEYMIPEVNSMIRGTLNE